MSYTLLLLLGLLWEAIPIDHSLGSAPDRRKQFAQFVPAPPKTSSRVTAKARGRRDEDDPPRHHADRTRPRTPGRSSACNPPPGFFIVRYSSRSFVPGRTRLFSGPASAQTFAGRLPFPSPACPCQLGSTTSRRSRRAPQQAAPTHAVLTMLPYLYRIAPVQGKYQASTKGAPRAMAATDGQIVPE